eukprot:scaffold20745_cov53-Phaeocystis_antarctica.AAC.5
MWRVLQVRRGGRGLEVGRDGQGGAERPQGYGRGVIAPARPFCWLASSPPRASSVAAEMCSASGGGDGGQDNAPAPSLS